MANTRRRLTPPSQAIFPVSRIRHVRVLYDGTVPPYREFSIAELVLHDGSHVIGIRHDRNTWNRNRDTNGYPVVRGGRPSWFILPVNIHEFLEELNRSVQQTDL